MLIVYLLITAAVITAGCFVISRISEVYDDFTDYYQDFNRYMDNRVPVKACEK